MRMAIVVMVLALLVVPSYATVVTVTSIPTLSPGPYQLYSSHDDTTYPGYGTGADTLGIVKPTTCAYPAYFNQDGATGVKGYTGNGFLQMTATAFGPSTGVSIDIPVGDLPFTVAGLSSLQLSYNWQMHPMYGPGRSAGSYPGTGDNNEYAAPLIKITLSDPLYGPVGGGVLLWDPANNPMPHLGVYDPNIPDGGMWDSWCPEPGDLGPTSSTDPGTYYPYLTATTGATGSANGWTEGEGSLYGAANQYDYWSPIGGSLDQIVAYLHSLGSKAPYITNISIWSGDWTGYAVQYVDDVTINFNKATGGSFDTTYDFEPPAAGPEPATLA